VTTVQFLRVSDGTRLLPAGCGPDGYGPTVSLVSTRPPEAPARSARGDLIAGGAAVALVLTATVVGLATGVRLHGNTYFPGAPMTFGEWPVLGDWLPHVGPGTPLAVVIAGAAVLWGPTLATRLSWRAALLAGYGLAVSWTFALALVDGWQRGLAGQLTSQDEYLAAVPGITDIPAMLRSFSSRILDFQPDSWTTHVAGHPPGATLIFVWLDRIGLSGGAWAAVVCVLVAGAAAVAVPVTISALGSRDLARAALPFVALLPGAVWLGVSADALFTGVTATGIALLSVGARRGRSAACLAGGVLLGFGIFLSYGLVLMSALAMAVVWASRSWRALMLGVVGALAVVAAFALAGFWWLDGYHLVVERYYQGIANDRPYGYWVWADLACLALAVGPAAAAGLRRAAPDFLAGLPGRRPVPTLPVIALVRAATLAVLTADLSGLSKAEVERIWLPFAVWLVAGAALLPERSRRGWLAAGALTALVVNHVLLTNW
jgi:methylthioxylose transferase